MVFFLFGGFLVFWKFPDVQSWYQLKREGIL